MRLLVVSDSHKKASVLDRIIRKEQNAKEIFFLGDVVEDIEDLPSVAPIRPKGKWIEIIDEETAYSKTWHYECSKCGKNNTCFGSNPNFCPHCGAKMVEPQESEE